LRRRRLKTYRGRDIGADPSLDEYARIDPLINAGAGFINQ
jgi:hypothetical protein